MTADMYCTGTKKSPHTPKETLTTIFTWSFQSSAVCPAAVLPDWARWSQW